MLLSSNYRISLITRRIHDPGGALSSSEGGGVRLGLNPAVTHRAEGKQTEISAKYMGLTAVTYKANDDSRLLPGATQLFAKVATALASAVHSLFTVNVYTAGVSTECH